jgi:hypothetical protein
MHSILLIIHVQIILLVAYPCAIFRHIHDPVVDLLKSLHLYACLPIQMKQLENWWTNLMKSDTGGYYEKLPNNFNFYSDWTIVKISLHEDLYAILCISLVWFIKYLSAFKIFWTRVAEKNEICSIQYNYSEGLKVLW